MHEPADNLSEIERLRQTVEALERRLLAVEQSLMALRQESAPPAQQRLSHWLNETRPDVAPRVVAPPVPAAPIPIASIAPVPAPIQQDFRTTTRSIETMIGQNWASWIGGIVLFLGIVFFLKYAWDKGWIRPSPGARVLTAIGFGVALGALGEWMHRKRLRGLAGSLYGVSVAVVVASLFASNAYFDPPVLSRGVAIVAAALTAGAAVGAALHINVMAVAIVALIGAYRAPVVLRSDRDESAFLLGYLLLLALVGWSLGYFKPRWMFLRWFVVICSYVSLMWWWAAMGDRHGHNTLALLWISIFFVGFLTEATLTLRRRARTSDPVERRLIFVPGLPAPLLDVNLAGTSLFSTAAAFGGWMLVLGQSDSRVLGALAIGMAVAQTLGAMTTVSRPFLVSSILQSAALVTVSVPLLTDDFAITIAWMLLAAVLATLAWQLNLNSARWWAAILLALAVGRLFLFDISNPTLRAAALTIASQPVSRWLLIGSAIAVLFHLLAWMRPSEAGFPQAGNWIRAKVNPQVREAGERKDVLEYASRRVAERAPMISWLDGDSALLAFIGTGLFVIVMSMQWSGPMITAAMIAWLAPIVLLAPQGRAIAYDWHGLILGSLTAARWVFLDNLDPLVDTWQNGAGLTPLLNVPSICGLLMMLAGIVLWRIDREKVHDRVLVGVAILAFAWCNFELWRTIDWLSASSAAQIADRGIVKQVAMSIMWGLLGLGGVVFGFRRNIPAVRWAALGLLGITLLKILIIDMSEVRAIWRILSFMAVGALLLCVSFVYHRQLQRRAT